MDKFVVVIFENENKAYDGVRALQELHEEGTVTVFGTVVAERGAGGELSIKQQSDAGPLGMGVGALAGMMLGVLGGPAGAAAGLAAGTAAGGIGDFWRAAVSDEFLEDVKRDLAPGKVAVIAEVSEDWLAPMDARMEALGGTIIREGREDFVDDRIERSVAASRAELAQWKAEHAGTEAERMQSKLEKKVGDAQHKLQRAADKARNQLDTRKQEIEAKMDALQQQAASATPEVRSRVQQRMDELRKDLEQREQKLRRAYELSQEALR